MPPRKKPPKRRGVTVAMVVNEHRKWAAERYVKNGEPTSEIKSYRTACRPVVRLYGDWLVDDFGAPRVARVPASAEGQGHRPKTR